MRRPFLGERENCGTSLARILHRGLLAVILPENSNYSLCHRGELTTPFSKIRKVWWAALAHCGNSFSGLFSTELRHLDFTLTQVDGLDFISQT